MGGDEFVILLPNIAEIANAVAIAEKIRKAIVEPFNIDGNIITSSLSELTF